MKSLIPKFEFTPEFFNDLMPVVKQAFDDLMVINGSSYVKLWELAQAIGINKVILYRFILSYPGHFEAGEHVEKKEKRTRNDSLTENLTGAKYTAFEEERNRGYCVFAIYSSPADKQGTKEWIAQQLPLQDIQRGDKVCATRKLTILKDGEAGATMREKCEEYFTVGHVGWNKDVNEFVCASPIGVHLLRDCKKA